MLTALCWVQGFALVLKWVSIDPSVNDTTFEAFYRINNYVTDWDSFQVPHRTVTPHTNLTSARRSRARVQWAPSNVIPSLCFHIAVFACLHWALVNGSGVFLSLALLTTSHHRPLLTVRGFGCRTR